MPQKSPTKSKFEIAVMQKIKALRQEKNLSQDDLAALLDVTRGFIGQVESLTNPSTYSLNHLNKLAFELKCSVTDLLPVKPVKETGWK
jgi:transcriptional regulator with XRE-family HTH domain